MIIHHDIFAKQYPAYNRLCIIDTEDKRIKALQLTGVGDVWGIGRRQTAKLEQQGVKTAYDFTELPPRRLTSIL